MLERGENIRTIQEHLGHTHVETTEIYAEADRAKAIEEAARKESARIAQERSKVEAEAQAKAKAEADAKRKAESAPDKDKIEAYAYAIAEMRLPPMATMEGRKLRHEIEEKAVAFAQWIRGKGNEL